MPSCIPECSNDGVCVNDNVCDCRKSLFTGSRCTEKGILKRNSYIDYLFLTLSSIIIVIIIIISISTYLHRNSNIIKAGNLYI